MNKYLRHSAALLLLAVTLKAHAIALIPTKVRNDSPVSVHIVVTRFAICLGPEKDKTGDWTDETTIAPHQDGTILLMGGAQGLCSGGARSITIETAPTTTGEPAPPTILSLSIADNLSDHWSSLHVQVDPKTNRFVLRAVPPHAISPSPH